MTKATGDAEKLDALALLKDDHARVAEQFATFRKTRSKSDPEQKIAQVEEVCRELAVHAALEEELFYPAVRAAIGDGELMGEAFVEHEEAKHLMSELMAMKPEDPLYDSKVQVLSEYVHHHVEEEQNKMFPKVRKAKMDLAALAEQLLERKKDLLEVAEAKGLKSLFASAQPAGRKRTS